MKDKNWLQNLKPLDDYALLEIVGRDAQTFLQGQLTANVKELSPDQALLTACCDHKGRMVANFWIWPRKEGFQLMIPKSMVDILVSHLKKYAVFSKIDMSESQMAFVMGVVMTKKRPPEENTLNNEQVKFLRLGHLEEAYFVIVSEASRENHDDGSLRSLRSVGMTDEEEKASVGRADEEEKDSVTVATARGKWEHFFIENGIAILSPETSGKLTPQMINLQKQGGVSFKKGCYLGQEVVARTEHLGKLKRHLYQFKADTHSVPHPGDSLFQNQESMGMIINAVINDHQQCLGLAVIEDRADKETLYLEGNHQRINIQII